MFTLKEIVEYFEGQYTQEQIELALDSLGVKPNQNGEFESTVTESLELVFNATQDAVNQLPPSATAQETKDLAIQLASERAIDLNIDVDSLGNIVDLVVSTGISKAVFLHQLEQQVVKKVSEDLESQELQDLNDESARKIAAFTKILKDPKALDKIIQEYGGTSDSEVAARQEALSAVSTFDVDSFLEEMEGEKKPVEVQITSIKDTKKLASTLLQRCKKSSISLSGVDS